MIYWTIPGTRWWSVQIEGTRSGWKFTPLSVFWAPGTYFEIQVAFGVSVQLHWYPPSERF